MAQKGSRMADEEHDQEQQDETGDVEQEQHEAEDERADDADKEQAPPKDDLERWRREARKWESRAKRNNAELAEARTKLQEREDADKSEQEKAVEAAARQAREEALTQAEKDRRADRLELAVVKIASVGGVKVDDKTTAKFTDPDDVQMWLEKQIERGDIDADDIYKDGKVNEDALASELVRLASAKPGWLVGAGKANGTPAGSADGGRGTPRGANSVEEELKAIQRNRQPARA